MCFVLPHSAVGFVATQNGRFHDLRIKIFFRFSWCLIDLAPWLNEAMIDCLSVGLSLAVDSNRNNSRTNRVSKVHVKAVLLSTQWNFLFFYLTHSFEHQMAVFTPCKMYMYIWAGVQKAKLTIMIANFNWWIDRWNKLVSSLTTPEFDGTGTVWLNSVGQSFIGEGR